jgi:uncharacterized protein YpmB
MQDNYKIIMVAILAAVVVVAAVSSTVRAQDAEKSADEKADSQADKGHIEQADKACEKEGYDGYIGGDCGYLN